MRLQLITHLDDLPAWGLKFSFVHRGLTEEGILLRLADGGLRAYKNECRHLPMPLDEREPYTYWSANADRLCCCSHGASFRLEDGLCIKGPCEGQRLIALPLVVDDGKVYLDLARISHHVA